MTTWIFYILIGVSIIFFGAIGIYIVSRLISAAVFTSYFEEKFKHVDLKGEYYGEEEDREEK